jgi:hypothetical protein
MVHSSWFMDLAEKYSHPILTGRPYLPPLAAGPLGRRRSAPPLRRGGRATAEAGETRAPVEEHSSPRRARLSATAPCAMRPSDHMGGAHHDLRTPRAGATLRLFRQRRGGLSPSPARLPLNVEREHGGAQAERPAANGWRRPGPHPPAGEFRTAFPPDGMVREVSEDGWGGGRRQDPLAEQGRRGRPGARGVRGHRLLTVIGLRRAQSSRHRAGGLSFPEKGL